jgi:hypothetical protein
MKIFPDSQVKYTGPDVESMGITKGMMLSEVISKLIAYILGFTEKKIALDCAFTGECDNCDYETDVHSALSSIISKICDLSSSDLKYSGSLKNIGSISGIDASALSGLSFDYSSVTTNRGTAFTYDLSNLKNSLPEGYQILSVRSRSYGALKNGTTLVQSTSAESGTINIDFDRFPATVQSEVTLLTPNGNVVLDSNVHMNTASTYSGSEVFEVKDFSEKSISSNMSLSDITDHLFNKISLVDNYIATLKGYTINNGSITSRGITNCLGSTATVADKAIQDLSILNKVSVPDSGCNDVVTGTIPESLSSINTLLKNYESRIAALEGNTN